MYSIRSINLILSSAFLALSTCGEPFVADQAADQAADQVAATKASGVEATAVSGVEATAVSGDEATPVSGDEGNVAGARYPLHPDIKPGMKRSEAYKIMGYIIENDGDSTGADWFGMSCDNFSYEENGVLKFIQVLYDEAGLNEEPRVREATMNHNEFCFYQYDTPVDHGAVEGQFPLSLSPDYKGTRAEEKYPLYPFIKPGMTRDEVANVFESGAVDDHRFPISGNCKSYKYIMDARTKYLHVGYDDNDIVTGATINHEIDCGWIE